MTKRYTDREVSLILQRALEPRAGSAELDPNELGFSLEQLKEIAAEVGINPQRIGLAASSLMEPSPASVNPYAGIPPTVQYQAMVASKDLADIPTHEVSAVIRSTLGRQGILNDQSASFEWRARDTFGGRYVSLTPSPEGTRLSVLGNSRDGLFTFLAGVGMAFFTGTAPVLAGAGFAPGGRTRRWLSSTPGWSHC